MRLTQSRLFTIVMLNLLLFTGGMFFATKFTIIAVLGLALVLCLGVLVKLIWIMCGDFANDRVS